MEVTILKPKGIYCLSSSTLFNYFDQVFHYFKMKLTWVFTITISRTVAQDSLHHAVRSSSSRLNIWPPRLRVNTKRSHVQSIYIQILSSTAKLNSRLNRPLPMLHFKMSKATNLRIFIAGVLLVYYTFGFSLVL